MAITLLDKVDQRTQLAGHNRVALLLFRLGDSQLFGINIFKVREVSRRSALERAPSAHPLVAGSCDYRGQTLPVIDLAAALGYAPLRDVASAHLMVTEFSRTMQGFLVADLQYMVNCDGDTVLPAPETLGFGAQVNAVTRVNGALVAIVDVEHVLGSIDSTPLTLSAHMQRMASAHFMRPRRVMVVDDSLIARRRIVELFAQMDIECLLAADGREALETLLALAESTTDDGVQLVLSDIEMPRLDGYALTRAIRDTPALRKLKVVLHSSISGVFNESMVKEVKADRFVAKFQPDLLVQAVLDLLPEPAANVSF